MSRLASALGESRQQLKWLAYSASFCAVALLAWGLSSPSGVTVPIHVQLLEGLAFVGVPVSAGIAILRHHLYDYDIDVVINKTLVVGAMAGFVTAVYGVVVAGAGALVHTTSPTPLAFAAMAVVAIAFHPVRERLQTVANRVVYGPTPDALRGREGVHPAHEPGPVAERRPARDGGGGRPRRGRGPGEGSALRAQRRGRGGHLAGAGPWERSTGPCRSSTAGAQDHR